MRLGVGSVNNFHGAGTQNVKAYEAYLQARSKRENRTSVSEAISLLERAVELDPNYAAAWTHLAWIDAVDACFGWEQDIEKTLARAEERIARALDLDPKNSMAQTVKGMVHLARRENKEAVACVENAAEMESTGENLGMLARVLKDAGRLEEALRRHTGFEIDDEVGDRHRPAEGRRLQHVVELGAVPEARMGDRDAGATFDLFEGDADLLAFVRSIRELLANR